MGKVPVPKGFWQRDAEELAIAFPTEYANNNTGYIEVKRNKKMILLHRWIWQQLVGDIPEGFEIDHINGVRTDNRLCNLRLVTHKMNAQNQKKRSDNSSGITGVSLAADKVRYRARWYEHGKLRQKVFDTIAAAESYRREKIKELNNSGDCYTDRHGSYE